MNCVVSYGYGFKIVLTDLTKQELIPHLLPTLVGSTGWYSKKTGMRKESAQETKKGIFVVLPNLHLHHNEYSITNVLYKI